MSITPQPKNIAQMGTAEVAWYIVFRHRVFLLILSNVMTLTIWLVTQAPSAINKLNG